MKFKIGQIVFVKDHYMTNEGKYGIVVEDLDTWYTIIMESGHVFEVGQDLIKPVEEDTLTTMAYMQPYFKALHNVFTETKEAMEERNK